MPADPGTDTGQRVGSKARALRTEQAHLDRVHDRVEGLRDRAASRVADASADRSGSTFQARFERDVVAHHHANRQHRFTFGDVESLVFGRLDLAQDDDPMHIGRLSVVDGDGDVILVDWRAPAAAAFYQATVATPMGVSRRRTMVTRGRTVHDLDDELLDADAADARGLASVSGQGALLASLGRERTGSMRDIVATIQADQDAIIRAPATGTLVVTGGPGTGKTVVALHRVASLLYRDRARFEGRGVLVIGPSRAFTEYTSRVLPALGEDRAVQRPLAALAPRGVVIQGYDDLEVARIKGNLAMVEVCRRLLAASLPPIPPDLRVSFEGTTVTVAAARIEQVRTRQLAKLAPDGDAASYIERRAAATESLHAALWRIWGRAHRQAGGRVPEHPEGSGFPSALEASPSMRMLHRCYWPERRPVEVLAALVDDVPRLRAAIGTVLPEDDVDRLVAAWTAASGPTHDDVAILDELAALIGREPTREEADPRDDGGLVVTSQTLRADEGAVEVAADDYRDFAHVVVDEAQDLTPMQWRAVARRGPYASWTVVGDLAQRSRVAEPADWDEVARLIGRREVHVRALSVNYRTPQEIAEVARVVLVAAGHDPDTAPQAVRATGEAPTLRTAVDPTTLVRDRVEELLATRDGTVAVIADDPRLPGLHEVLANVDAGPDGPGRRVRVLDPRTAKGLEFDDVVVVAPDEIVAASAVGPHQLYVAVTRATRSLTVLAAPEADFPGRALLDAG
ncbi:MAG: ATP-binding domain-containing protein [Nitriliruptoraceae bacterium]|nr:ATP-binding domain-containing protein [Nitriliruptoraceae bacterium]